MGFSVSGATVILFLGLFISFGIAYSAASDGFEQVHDAYQDSTDDDLVRTNTGIEIAEASVANQDGQLYLNVTVNNTGTTTLSVDDTDILIDGTYRAHTEIDVLEVEGNSETDLWLPGEQLQVNASVASEPSRVKVVSEPGVADGEVI
ncbi:fla cluster protein FlaF [Halobacteriales archaeon QS_1_67_19]|nr:MAG: fla cluster protein FlaF [Halobacteriales archaeon QS_1_67_19]